MNARNKQDNSGRTINSGRMKIFVSYMITSVAKFRNERKIGPSDP